MTLLLEEIDVLETSGDPGGLEVLGIEHDSRRVGPGDFFCCLPGHALDGHQFAAEAMRRGAVGVLVERPVAVAGDVVRVRVAPGAARPAMAHLAAAFFDHPARDLTTVGVTGTNAKTTVTHLVAAAMAHAGRPTSVIGTLSGARTTPEAPDLQRSLASVRDAHPGGPRPVVALEVSSHALVQSRVEAMTFDVAVFTNLSHDHLDFHHTMDDYFAAKARLFEPSMARRAVVNVDDAWGRRLADQVRVPAVAVSADQICDVRLGPGRSSFSWRGEQVDLALTGMVNVHNALLAAEVAVVLGVSPRVVAEGLATASPVAGRLEAVASPGPGAPGPTVLVDYAHTPAALEAALLEARRLAAPTGRVIVVFGCGGDRDKAKRPVMGAVAARIADAVVVTSDNPRHEDPAAIVADIVAGTTMSGPASTADVTVEPDRRQAIVVALASAGPGDVVVVAGKGHETYQELADRKVPFDDRVVVRQVLATVAPATPGRAAGS